MTFGYFSLRCLGPAVVGIGARGVGRPPAMYSAKILAARSSTSADRAATGSALAAASGLVCSSAVHSLSRSSSPPWPVGSSSSTSSSSRLASSSSSSAASLWSASLASSEASPHSSSSASSCESCLKRSHIGDSSLGFLCDLSGSWRSSSSSSYPCRCTRSALASLGPVRSLRVLWHVSQLASLGTSDGEERTTLGL
ncbi:hypothetical protein FKP32DRAFT_446006 [Trametes sanguinea]|nr:hypothetical protein FKP32DRAFT_446006 [Trametes sanguinea]